MITIQEIKDAISWLENDVYGEYFGQISNNEDLYGLRYNVDIPTNLMNVRPIRPITPRTLLDTAVDHVPTNHPVIRVPSLGDKPGQQEHANRLERFYMGLMYQTAMQPKNTFDIVRKHLALHGIGVEKTVYNDKAYPEREEDETDERFEQRRRDAHPILIMPVHPNNFMPEPVFYSTFVIERAKKTVRAIRNIFPNWRTDRDPKEKVDWHEYWDDTYHCYLADKEPIMESGIQKHGYGFIPYSWGYTDKGLETDDSNPAESSIGLLTPLKQTIEEDGARWSQYHAINTFVAWPTVFFIGADKAMLQPVDLGVNPGQAIPLPEGITLERWPAGEPSPAILSEMALLKNMQEDFAAPPLTRGLAAPGVRSGYDRALGTEQGGLRYEGISQTLDKITSKALSNCVKLVERKLPGPITVWGVNAMGKTEEETLKSEDVKGHYIVSVEFSEAEAEKNYRSGQMGANLAQSEVISKKRAREVYAGVPDPNEEEIQIQTEKILNYPSIQEMVAQLAAIKINQRLQASMIKSGVPPIYSEPGRTTVPPVSSPGVPGGTPKGMPQGALAPQPMPGFPPNEPKPFSSEEQERIITAEKNKLRGGA